MTKLSVNVNKIATLRNTRPQLNVPDLVRLSRLALEAGAQGLTIHPRPDERHIRAADVLPLSHLAAEFPNVEFNIEGNPFHGDYMKHCRDTRPTQCTLVPDTEAQSTSDHGWDLQRDGARLMPVICELQELGCRVSLFLDPVPTGVLAARKLGANRIELYTEPYARAFERRDVSMLTAYSEAARAASAAGLGINAGHDLNLKNLGPFLKAVPDVVEVSIGHALIADALELGLAETIRRYVTICQGG